ncbi:MAG: DUF5665 domain-containing protein [Christensenellales bacterium]
MSKKSNFDSLNEKVEQLIINSEKDRIKEYIAYQKRPREVFKLNFIAGLFRGLGMAIGFTILGAIVIMILRRLAQDNLSGIGKFISDIMDIVESYR